MTWMSMPRQPSILDAAVADPDNDLLQIAPYAERLADFIAALEPRFTIGVYGAWGSGKTTFVRFVEAFLTRKVKDVKFITFDAWPFKTSDDLWRGLVHKIAKALYDVGDAEEPSRASAGPDPTEPFIVRIGRRLREPAFHLRRDKVEPPKNADYYELLDRLDHTLYGGARRPKDDGRTLDEDGTLVALVQGTVAALGSVSPLLGAVRSFFGFENKVDVAQLLQQEKNETARRRIESVDQFRKALKDLFAARAQGRRVCVFIDDLDRCMPDVALDLLEALKIFLGETDCIFIVAADEQLIGEGLRIRYRELLELAGSDQSAAVFARKGREYFEKIIQLGIRVPDHSAEDVHNYIAAQFPQWLPATDLIQAAVGTNPRRLKQHCTLLSYKYMVAREADADDVTDDPRLLNKLIELQSWNADVASLMRELSADEQLSAILGRLENCLRDSAQDEKRPTAGTEINNPIAHAIYEKAVESAPLYRLFTEPPLLSRCPAGDVASLLNLVDVVPAPDAPVMLRGRDRVLMRIMEKVARTRDVSPTKLLIDDLTKLFTLDVMKPEVTPLLRDMASGERWSERMAAVETGVDGVFGRETLFDDDVSAMWALAKEDDDLRKLLLEAPLLSSMLPEAVLAWHALRESVPATKSLSGSPAGRAALAVFEILEQEERENLEAKLLLRIRVARHFSQLRKFVKLDSLAYSWPDFARHLRTDLAGVRAFESNVVDPDQSPAELSPLWQKFLADEQLVAFLRLRPLLSHIYGDELGQFLDLTEAVVSAPDVAQDLAEPTPPGLPSQASPPVVEFEEPQYINTYLSITATPAGRFDVVLGADSSAHETVEVNWERINGKMRRFASHREASSDKAHDVITELRELGGELYNWFFQGSVDAMMAGILRAGAARRFLLTLDASLQSLPWEALYAPHPARQFPGLTTKYSLVRLGEMTDSALRTFTPPLRILAVFSSPNVAPLPFAEEEGLLFGALEPAVRRGTVVVDVVKGRDATLDNVQRMLGMRRPHIFHFSGHRYYQPDAEGGLLLEDSSGALNEVSASILNRTLREANVMFAVLSGCGAGPSMPETEAGVAGMLAQAGVPGVIGPIRSVPDDAALLFTREFYRALIAGRSVEAAVVEARKALSVERWDWSAFALFSSSPDLSGLRLEFPAGQRAP